SPPLSPLKTIPPPFSPGPLIVACVAPFPSAVEAATRAPTATRASTERAFMTAPFDRIDAVSTPAPRGRFLDGGRGADERRLEICDQLLRRLEPHGAADGGPRRGD